MSGKSVTNLPVGFSPCPNDTFIFDAWVNGRIEQDFLPQPQLLDVETLNRKALLAELPVTKLSFAAYARVSEQYQILSAGAALGNNCGPLVIYRQPPDLSQSASLKVAIPGLHTTANLLFSIFFPQLTQKVEMVFSEIENAVLSGEADLGLIIHENRFTYAAKGLQKLADLGELWETKFNLPIPLGCIAVRRDMPEDDKKQIGASVKNSVAWAFAHPDDSRHYVRMHAQEMSEAVQQQHISLYVNRFSRDLGNEGRTAVRKLLEEGIKAGFLPSLKEPIFAEDE